MFGPFLVLPALFLIEQMVTRGIKLRQLAGGRDSSAGLLFSFSRGAWVNFSVAAAVMLALIMLTGPTRSARMRPIVLGVVVRCRRRAGAGGIDERSTRCAK